MQLKNKPKSIEKTSRTEGKKELILAALDKNKAENIITIPLSNKSDLADYMIIATGGSSRHVSALADKVAYDIKQEFQSLAAIEGKAESKWVLLDYYDIIVHIFDKETREFYKLEKMWLV